MSADKDWYKKLLEFIEKEKRNEQRSQEIKRNS